MSEKQCVRCGRVGHNSDECKWLEVMTADQKLRDEMFKFEMTQRANLVTHDVLMALAEEVRETCWQVGSGDATIRELDLTATVDRYAVQLPSATQPLAAAGLHLNPAQVAALREVLRISDRQHDAWDTLKAALEDNQ